MKMKSRSAIIKKTAVSALAAVVLFVLYAVIFSFSGQDGEASGNLSFYVSEKCVGIMNSISGRHWTAEYFEHPIRKLAHFSEYACMGILVYILLRPWLERGKKLYLIIVLWVFVSAAADEIHQLFVPGRCGSPADVCLDTLGGAFGILICVLLEKIVRRRHLKCARK